MILPLVQTYEEGNDRPFLSNELAWSAGFNDELKLGELTLDFLEKFIDIAMSGAYINTEDFISVGKFKTSLKIVAWYEFLLRSAYKSKKVFVVPKVGVNRKFKPADDSISKEEADWLIKTARQEYFFDEDRGKKFSEEGK